MDIIKALQQNKEPFGLMSTDEFTNEEMQAKAKSIGKNDAFEILRESLDDSSKVYWCELNQETYNDAFGGDTTYRLRPNYEAPEEKPVHFEHSDLLFELTGNVVIMSREGDKEKIGWFVLDDEFIAKITYANEIVKEEVAVVDVRRSQPVPEEKPEIVECEVYVNKNGYSVYNCPEHNRHNGTSIVEAPCRPDWSGFKFDGSEDVFPEMVKFKKGGVIRHHATLEDLKSGASVPVYPKQVLFQVKK